VDLTPFLFNKGYFLVDHSSIQNTGKVYLVGAGPGDPDLLTVKAVRTLGFADVVLHDALVSAEVLVLLPAEAQVINVGKRCGKKSISQEEINRLLVQYATAGKRVIRLKSGDPSIFGRAGEELDCLREAGVEVEIIPGITASLAAAAKVQASLTDRRTADQLLFISAHRRPGKDGSDWHAVVTSRTTVVIYMPGEYAGVAEDLRQAGLSGSTPCAIVSRVSTREERWHQTTLELLSEAPSLPSPCVLIVGETLAAAASRDIRSLCLENIPAQGDFRLPPESAL
jgi:uroporphyrin-III C-methyltransferase